MAVQPSRCEGSIFGKWHGSCIVLDVAGTSASPSETGVRTMQTINLRQIAVSMSGAFVAAMLFVSAAVGPLPIA
jgi:hypothetical protein